MEHLKELGANLKAARKRAGLEQTEVAARLGVHSVTVSNWERGEKEPDEATIARLADLYHLPRAIVRYGEDGVTALIQRLEAFLSEERTRYVAPPRATPLPARARGRLEEPAAAPATAVPKRRA